MRVCVCVLLALEGASVFSRQLQRPVLDPVLVDAEVVQHLGAEAGAARPQALLLVPHQPPVAGGRHVARHVLAGPGVQPGLEAPVQPGVDALVGLVGESRGKEEVKERG